MTRYRIAILILVGITTLAGVGVKSSQHDGKFHVDVLDVGQGDAILITTPEGVRVLVDGGPGDNILRSIHKSLSILDRRIDLVVLTHPDADHLEGLVPILKRYEVQAVLRTNAVKQTAAFETFTDLVAEKNVLDQEVYMGDKLTLGEEVEFDILWPPQEWQESKVNEMSVVGQLRHKGYKFLLTGDIGSATENSMIKYIKDEYLRSDVLKVAHHGSKHSTTLRFLGASKPRVGVVSAGKDNWYGHPTPEVLERLESVGADILRTDISGTINFLVNKEGLVINTSN